MRHICVRLDKRRDLSYFAFTPSAEMDVEVFFFALRHAPLHLRKLEDAPYEPGFRRAEITLQRG
jgi:hypothetical protein